MDRDIENRNKECFNTFFIISNINFVKELPVSRFIGGSAKSMANQIMEGYILINPGMIKRYNLDELRRLRIELEKLQREIRAQIVPQDDTQAIQTKNHRMQKMSTALLIIRAHCMKVFRRV